MAALPRLRVHSLGSPAGLPPNAPPVPMQRPRLLPTSPAAYPTPPCLREPSPPFFALKVAGHSRREIRRWRSKWTLQPQSEPSSTLSSSRPLSSRAFPLLAGLSTLTCTAAASPSSSPAEIQECPFAKSPLSG